jgi:hypothetical protein
MLVSSIRLWLAPAVLHWLACSLRLAGWPRLVFGRLFLLPCYECLAPACWLRLVGRLSLWLNGLGRLALSCQLPTACWLSGSGWLHLDGFLRLRCWLAPVSWQVPAGWLPPVGRLALAGCLASAGWLPVWFRLVAGSLRLSNCLRLFECLWLRQLLSGWLASLDPGGGLSSDDWFASSSSLRLAGGTGWLFRCLQLTVWIHLAPACFFRLDGWCTWVQVAV